jgi:hypothetical protein
MSECLHSAKLAEAMLSSHKLDSVLDVITSASQGERETSWNAPGIDSWWNPITLRYTA